MRHSTQRKVGTVAVLLTLFAAQSLWAQAPSVAHPTPERLHTLTGVFRTHPAFHSRFLSDERDLIVYLPPGYEQHPKTRYPVLYMHDGQNLFDSATAFLGREWQADETAQSLILAEKIRPLIIVGIYNTGAKRLEEYTPTRDSKGRGGQAEAYGRLLVKELKPFIDAHYRTLKGTANTALGGSSLGGLVTLYLGLKYPRVFGNLAIMSPSTWWANKAILNDVKAYRQKPSARLWLDIGSAEDRTPSESAKVVNETRELRDALLARGWKLNANLHYMEAEGEQHNETAWAKRFGPMLEFLFPPQEQREREHTQENRL